LADQIELDPGQGHDMEGIHDGDRVRDRLGGSGFVASKAVHGHDFDPGREGGGLGGQPGRQRCSRATGAQKIVVCVSSTAASVIVTPNSMVRMIVSATTDGGQAVASGNGSPRWC
jgi:hypothetical protein